MGTFRKVVFDRVDERVHSKVDAKVVRFALYYIRYGIDYPILYPIVGRTGRNMALAALLSVGHNPFTSNVVHLTPGNWSLLERSPQLWLVNVCRQS